MLFYRMCVIARRLTSVIVARRRLSAGPTDKFEQSRCSRISLYNPDA